MEQGGHWLSLMDYANQNDVSLSTLRRHIKAQKVRYKTENGRYFLWSNSISPSTESPLSLVEELKLQLRMAHEEIAELKTLVAFYEDQSESSRGNA